MKLLRLCLNWSSHLLQVVFGRAFCFTLRVETFVERMLEVLAQKPTSICTNDSVLTTCAQSCTNWPVSFEHDNNFKKSFFFVFATVNLIWFTMPLQKAKAIAWHDCPGIWGRARQHIHTYLYKSFTGHCSRENKKRVYLKPGAGKLRTCASSCARSCTSSRRAA
jgi:hypothetical protein